jgi:serine/threonine-protein phosphatase PP1 catalytic subunit
MPAHLAELIKILPKIKNIFIMEDPVITGKLPCMIVGDLHGNKKALDFIIRMWMSFDYPLLLFLGDYIDRGTASVDVLTSLFGMKLQDWGNIILLRGNHESIEMNRKYGFFEDIGRDEELLEELNSIFKKMPVAAILPEGIFCVHAGIPGACNIDDINKEKSFEYFWNDPWEHQGMGFSPRGIGIHLFGADVLEDFFKRNQLKMMIRAHSALKQGYEWYFDKKLLSLFSSPDYCGTNNQGAFALLHNSEMNIYVFGGKEGKYELVEMSNIVMSHVL